MKRWVLFIGIVLFSTFMGSTVYSKTLEGLYFSATVSGASQQYEDSQIATSSMSHSFDDKDDTGYGAGVAVGYDFNKKLRFPVRMEIEYMVRSETDATWSGNQGILVPGNFNWELKGEQSLDTVLLNIYYDFKISNRFTPYIGGSVGFGFLDASIKYSDSFGTPPISLSEDETNFVWSMGAGCSYAINDKWSMGFGYRYLDAGESELSYLGALKVNTDTALHEFCLSLRYRF